MEILNIPLKEGAYVRGGEERRNCDTSTKNPGYGPAIAISSFQSSFLLQYVLRIFTFLFLVDKQMLYQRSGAAVTVSRQL